MVLYCASSSPLWCQVWKQIIHSDHRCHRFVSTAKLVDESLLLLSCVTRLDGSMCSLLKAAIMHIPKRTNTDLLLITHSQLFIKVLSCEMRTGSGVLTPTMVLSGSMTILDYYWQGVPFIWYKDETHPQWAKCCELNVHNKTKLSCTWKSSHLSFVWVCKPQPGVLLSPATYMYVFYKLIICY